MRRKQVRKRHPGTGIVVLSQYDEPDYAISLLSEGAAGYAYLLKDRVAEGDELFRAIRAVTTGGSMLDPRIVEALVRPASQGTDLTPDEEELLQLLAEGRTMKAIAVAQGTTPAAVDDAVQKLFLKLAQAASSGASGALRRLKLLHQAIVDREEQGESLSRLLPTGIAEKLRREGRNIGGTETLTVTVLMSDIRGYTTIAEDADPTVLARQLNEHRAEMNRAILAESGTVMQFVGDSVMAAWGMPLEDPEHPRKAVQAAWELSEASKLVVRGRVLTTRVGVSTGNVLAGNLGSPYRFDYTCIGDTTNLASRLEGMNKMLGTSVLISESTAKRLKNEFVMRLTGYFAVAGKKQGIAVYEVLGPTKDGTNDLSWLPSFNQALEGVKTGAFEDAKALFRKTIWERGGEDGPSQFYLTKIVQLEKSDQLREWTGVVRLDEK